MSDCCVEGSVAGVLRRIACGVIPDENFYTRRRKKSSCLPFVVVSASSFSGLRTSSGVENLDRVTITAVFHEDDEKSLSFMKSALKSWLGSSGCVTLDDCGCACIRGGVTISEQFTGGYAVVTTVFSAAFHFADVISESV
jgi:hypothetical protein